MLQVAMIVCDCLDVHGYLAMALEDIMFIQIDHIENDPYKTRIPLPLV